MADRFPSPFEIETPAGAEGWQGLYSYSLPFSEDRREYEDSMFWFQDGVHWPEVISPWDATFYEFAIASLSQYNTRHYLIPPALGVDYRVLNGYAFLSPVGVADPAEIEARVPHFLERAGFYFQNWSTLYDQWMRKIRALVGEMEALRFDPLPDKEELAVVTEGRGTGSGLELLARYHRLVDLALQLWQYHFEFLNLGYAAYLDFFGFCKQAFPNVPDLAIAKMVAGVEVDLFQPDEELKKLARLAVDTGVDAAFGQKLGLARVVFPYVENHNFYVEHWSHSVLWRKLRQLGGTLVKEGFFTQEDDVFLLKRDELPEALWDMYSAWAVGVQPRGPKYWPRELDRRRRILAALRAWSPPPALGRPPEVVTEPFTIMLWGITGDSVKQWLGSSEGGDGGLRGFAASTATTARSTCSTDRRRSDHAHRAAERRADPRRSRHADGRAPAPLLVPGRVHQPARRVPRQTGAPARRGLGGLPHRRRRLRDRGGALPAPAGVAGLRRRRARRHPLRLPRLAVRAGRHLPGPARRDGEDRVQGPRQGQRRPGPGAGRHGLGLPRPAAGAAAATLRRLRDGGPARYRPCDAAVQLAPDHGERRRPAPRRVAARPLLRVPRQPARLRGAGVLPAQARQDRLRRVRARHHQAAPARRAHRGGRRLGGRPPDGLPVLHAGGRRRDRPDADPRPGRRHHHLVRALHRPQPGWRPLAAAGDDPRVRAALARRPGQPHRRLRRGPGHHGLGDPGRDHRPDRRAPRQVRRGDRDAAQAVQAAARRRRRGPRSHRCGPRPGPQLAHRPALREEQVRGGRRVRDPVDRPGLLPVLAAARRAAAVARRGRRIQGEGRNRCLRGRRRRPHGSDRKSTRLN